MGQTQAFIINKSHYFVASWWDRERLATFAAQHGAQTHNRGIKSHMLYQLEGEMMQENCWYSHSTVSIKPPYEVSDWLFRISHRVLEGLMRSAREDRKKEERISGEVIWETWRKGQPIDSPMSLDLLGLYLNF